MLNKPSRISLILCGSAMSVMGELLAGSAPLRGRAADIGHHPTCALDGRDRVLTIGLDDLFGTPE